MSIRFILTSICILLMTFPHHVRAAEVALPWHLSKEDKAHMKNARYWLGKNSWKDARLHAKRASDPLILEIFEWMKYTSYSSGVSFAKISEFAKSHEHWPNISRLRRNTEYRLNSHVPTKQIIKWFKRDDGSFAEPLTAKGKYYLAKSLMSLKKHAALTKKLFKEAWVELDARTKEERTFLKEYRKKLSKKEYIERIERLLLKKKIIKAKWLIARLDEDYQKLFKARIKLMQDAPGVDNFVKRVPQSLQRNDGLLYERMAWRARRNKSEGVKEILQMVPPSAKHASLFWPYRNKYIRRLLRQKKYQEAYLLAKNHGIKSGAAFADGEWLSGWISLRYLKKPKQAYEHFFTLFHGVKTPISLGRASYWAARAAEENQNIQIASKWYVIAAKYPTTFYGQLATQKIGRKELYLPEKPKIQPRDMVYMKQNMLAEGAYLFSRLGMHRNSYKFIRAAVNHASTNAEKSLVARLGSAIGRLDYGVHAAKEASTDGTILPESFYPSSSKIRQGIKRVSKHPETSLIHSIILQESMFDPNARSGSKALGLMQLMPYTAKMVARRIGRKHHRSQLTSDPAYNVMLGTRYIRDLLTEYKGSYILAIASYNGGAGNVNKWVRAYGDPRKMKDHKDIIDWVENIPFGETRNYVQRVLENIQMFRYTQKVNKRPYVSLAEDMQRGQL